MNDGKRTYRIDFWYNDKYQGMYVKEFRFTLTRREYEDIKFYDEYGEWHGFDPYLIRDRYMSKYQRRKLDGLFGRRGQAVMYAG